MSNRALSLKPFFYVLVLALISAPLSPVNAHGAADPGGPETEPGQPTISTLPDGTSIFSFPARPDVPAGQPDTQYPGLVASGFGQPSLAMASGDDRENSTPTTWAVYEHLTTADILNIATTNNYRVVDLFVETATNPYQFTAVFVANTGSYAKTWWFLTAATPTNLLNFAVSNNARIIVQKAFNDPTPGGSVLFYSVLISNTGADAKSWWFYKDQTVANVTALWQANNARLVQVNSYVRNSTTYYDVVMISNTGADARTWWWYVSATPAQLDTSLSNNNARMYDLDYDAATGNYNAIMTSCSGGCPAWEWYYGISTSNLLNTVLQHGERIMDANVTPGCGDLCWAIVLIDNSPKTISGNAGVAGTTLTYTGGSTTADSAGNYSFTVSPGWTGTVTPSKTSYTFSPVNKSYTNVLANQTAQNFTATAITPDNIAVYRWTTGGAYWLNYNFSTASFTNYLSTGDGGSSATCYPVSMDFDGDGIDEPTHLCGGGWHFFELNGAFVKSIFAYMQPGDIPVPGDYNGDGKDEVAIYRRATGGAYWLFYDFATASFTNYVSLGDGGSSATCYPAAMDFDGDGADELTHLCGGGWHFFETNGTFVKSIFAYMQPGDLPVPGDYNGDGKDEVAVYRRSTGGAYWLNYDFATASFTNYLSLGDGGSSAACYPAAMDFDADGIDEPTHLCGGGWHFFETNGAFVKSIFAYMQVGDKPVPGKYGN